MLTRVSPLSVISSEMKFFDSIAFNGHLSTILKSFNSLVVDFTPLMSGYSKLSRIQHIRSFDLATLINDK